MELVERALLPVDRVRREAFRAARVIPGFTRLITRRGFRIGVTATVHALGALVLTIFLPMLLMVLGPILLGVAHVGADVRHLVLRRALPSWWKVGIWVGIGSLIAIRILQEVFEFHPSVARLELGAVAVFALVGLVAGGTRSGRHLRVLLLAPVVCAFFLLSLYKPFHVMLGFVHLHNLVAIGLWLWLFRSSLTAAIVPLIVILAGTLLLLFGPAFAWSLDHGMSEAFGLHLLSAAEWMAPGLGSSDFAVGLTLSFVFLQSIHYSMWLLIIPQEDAKTETPTTFRRSLRSLLEDFGKPLLFLVTVSAVAVVVASFFDVLATRRLYLSMAMFHGYLEVVLGLYFFGQGGLLPKPAT
jgi:hypothetical protein